MPPVTKKHDQIWGRITPMISRLIYRFKVSWADTVLYLRSKISVRLSPPCQSEGLTPTYFFIPREIRGPVISTEWFSFIRCGKARDFLLLVLPRFICHDFVSQYFSTWGCREPFLDGRNYRAASAWVSPSTNQVWNVCCECTTHVVDNDRWATVDWVAVQKRLKTTVVWGAAKILTRVKQCVVNIERTSNSKRKLWSRFLNWQHRHLATILLLLKQRLGNDALLINDLIDLTFHHNAPQLSFVWPSKPRFSLRVKNALWRFWNRFANTTRTLFVTCYLLFFDW